MRLRDVVIGEARVCQSCVKTSIYADGVVSKLEDVIPAEEWVEIKTDTAIYRWVPELVMVVEGLPDFPSPISKDDA